MQITNNVENMLVVSETKEEAKVLSLLMEIIMGNKGEKKSVSFDIDFENPVMVKMIINNVCL